MGSLWPAVVRLTNSEQEENDKVHKVMLERMRTLAVKVMTALEGGEHNHNPSITSIPMPFHSTPPPPQPQASLAASAPTAAVRISNRVDSGPHHGGDENKLKPKFDDNCVGDGVAGRQGPRGNVAKKIGNGGVAAAQSNTSLRGRPLVR